MAAPQDELLFAPFAEGRDPHQESTRLSSLILRSLRQRAFRTTKQSQLPQFSSGLGLAILCGLCITERTQYFPFFSDS